MTSLKICYIWIDIKKIVEVGQEVQTIKEKTDNIITIKEVKEIVKIGKVDKVLIGIEIQEIKKDAILPNHPVAQVVKVEEAGVAIKLSKTKNNKPNFLY